MNMLPSIFDGMSEMDVNVALRHFNRIEVGDRQQLVAEGDVDPTLAIVESGELEVMTGDTRLGYIRSGGMMGEMALFSDWLRTASRAGDHLLSLIDDILDLSRLEAGQPAIEAADFDLRGAINGAADLLRAKAQEKGLSLLVETCSSLPDTVHGDSGRLRQILINVLGNAVKFTAQGHVVLRAQGDPQTPWQVTIEIEDTGVGIPQNQQGAIFDRFSQADSAVTRAFGGTGLGLAISRILAERMGGGISVVSEPGMGSCFRVQLTFGPPQGAAGAEEGAALQADHSALDGCRILLAEDNKTNRLLIGKYLQDLPVEVVEAVNGREAIDRCLEQCPDIILMDMSMPELDGLSATRRLGRHRHARRCAFPARRWRASRCDPRR